MIIIVDVNIFLSALIKDSTTREILIKSGHIFYLKESNGTDISTLLPKNKLTHRHTPTIDGKQHTPENIQLCKIYNTLTPPLWGRGFARYKALCRSFPPSPTRRARRATSWCSTCSARPTPSSSCWHAARRASSRCWTRRTRAR